jgi:O-antigen/teichoic acid export membrane protein
MDRRFLRNTVFGSAAALITALGNFLGSLLVARILGVTETGAYAFALWIVATTTTVTEFGLPFTLSRYLPELIEKEGRSRAKGVTRFLLGRAALASALPIIVLSCYAFWIFIHGEQSANSASVSETLASPITWLLIGLAGTTISLSDFARGYLRGVHNMDRVAKLLSISTLVQLVCIATGAAIFGTKGAIGGYCIGAMIPAIALRDLKGSAPDCSIELRHRIAKFTRFRWASEIASAFVFARMEIFFLQLNSDSHAVGLFAAALTMANLAIQGPLTLTWGLLPHFSEQFGKSDFVSLRNSYAAGTRLFALIIFPACFGLAALTPQLMPLLYGSSFSAAVPAAILLVSAAAFSATGLIGSNLIWAMEKNHVDFYFSVAGAIVSLTIGLPLVAYFGIMGAAGARAGIQTFIVALSCWFLIRHLHFKIPFLALGRIALSAAICALAAFFVTSSIHGVLGLVLAVPLGAIVYLACISLTSALEPDDVAKLMEGCSRLPRPLGNLAQRYMQLAIK